MSPSQAYRDLRVWHESVKLVEQCYGLSRSFPREELYRLTAQVRAAATSIPANIAEGNGRESPGEYAHFLHIAQGSLKELETHLVVARRVGLAPADAVEAVEAQCVVVSNMLRGLIRSVKPG